MASLAKVDERGRLVIPSKIKKRMKIGTTVLLEERDGTLELTPIADPLEKLKGSAKARITARQLDELSESISVRESFK